MAELIPGPSGRRGPGRALSCVGSEGEERLAAVRGALTGFPWLSPGGSRFRVSLQRLQGCLALWGHSQEGEWAGPPKMWRDTEP